MIVLVSGALRNELWVKATAFVHISERIEKQSLVFDLDHHSRFLRDRRIKWRSTLERLSTRLSRHMLHMVK